MPNLIQPHRSLRAGARAGIRRPLYALPLTTLGLLLAVVLTLQTSVSAQAAGGQEGAPGQSSAGPAPRTEAPPSVQGGEGPLAPNAPAAGNEAYAFSIDCSQSLLINFDLDTPGTQTTVGDSTPGGFCNFISGADFNLSGELYAIEFNNARAPSRLFRVDKANGATTLIGTATPVASHRFTALTYDATTDTWYAVSTSGSVSTLYTINVTTAAATVVGNITGSPIIIGISANRAGVLYGIDIANDNLVTINKLTGASTPVGPLGIDINFAQDIGFDSTDRLYHAAFNNTLSRPELRVIDTASGSSTLVGPFTGRPEIDGLAIPFPPAPPHQLIISEFTPRGPLGALDEFVEIFNDTDSPHTVTASDTSDGYSVAAEDGQTRCVIPNGTVIPARGHFLCAGAQYIYIGDVFPDAFNIGPNNGDIGDNQGVALFNTSDPDLYGPSTRFDAFGYTSSPPLYREGAGFPYVVAANAPRAYIRTQYNTYEKDTDDNAADFISVNARLDVCCDPNSVLGMAGPQNLASPINRGAATPMSLFDPDAASSAPSNRERSAVVVPNGSFGTLRFRRRVTNNTGAPVTRMRIRVVDMSTLQSPTADAPGKATHCVTPCADLRVLSSSDEAAIATTSGPQPTSGTTLELAAYQTIGGGYNSSLNVNQVMNISPVAPGGFINVNILLGVEQTGNARFFVTVEVLP